MMLVRHELRQGRKAFAVWTAAIGILLATCVFLYPEMKEQMGSIGELFASMGAFTEAFGMDRLNFGTLIGYYAVECGNILGLGGALFASLTAVSALAKEEKDGTAEFLLSHPVSRFRVVTEKLAAVLIRVLGMNLPVGGLAVLSILAVGEAVPWKELSLLHLAWLLMQIEFAGICFGVSAFIRRGSLGIGLGITATLYFLNLLANLTDSAAFLKYVTPFGYTEGADILSDCALDMPLVFLGVGCAVAGTVLAYIRYCRKDIR